MSSFDKIVEERIRRAMENGEFDDLPGKGRPVDLSDYFQLPAHLRMAYDLLKKSGVLPAEITLQQEIARLKEKRRLCRDVPERERLTQKINEKTVELQVRLEKLRLAKGK